MIIKILEIIKKVLHSNHKKFHNLFYNNLSKMFLCLKIGNYNSWHKLKDK